jgi:hypothetical protein
MAAVLQAVPLVLKGHANPNPFETNEVLKHLYETLQACDFGAKRHSEMLGLLEEYLFTDNAFIVANSANPNVLWSVVTLLTYYLIRYVRHQSRVFAAGSQSVTDIQAPEGVVSCWADLITRLADQLQRPLSWYDLLYANNWRVTEQGMNAIFLVNDVPKPGPDGVIQPSLALSDEDRFVVAMVKIGAAPEAAPERLAKALDEHRFTDKLFYENYIVNFGYFYRIKPYLKERLQTISMRFPLPCLNDHFGIKSDQVESFITNE